MIPWWDPAVTLANVLATLRLGATSIDVDAVTDLIPAAGQAITDYIDPVTVIAGPPPDPALQAVLEAVTIDMYHRAQTAATIGGGVSTLRPAEGPFDPLAGVLAELAPWAEQWGIA